MSLIFDLKNIKDFRTTCWNGDDLKPVTNVIIISSMILDLGSITEENVTEWYKRYKFLERVLGITYLTYTSEDEHYSRNPDMDELKKHIGFRVNVADVKSFRTWATKKMKVKITDFELEISKEITNFKKEKS